MRPRRRVVVTIELETAAPLSELRCKSRWHFSASADRLLAADRAVILQVQANAIRAGR